MKKEGMNNLRKIMNRTEFCCVYQLADAMAQYVEENLTEYNYPVVAVYANYEVAKELVETLIMSGNGIGGILELESYEMSNYDKPFVIYLTEDGVTCEKIYRDGVYYRGESDVAFVHEDCNSAILDYIYADVALEFGFTGECEMDEEELEELECECDCHVGDCCTCNNDDNELAIESDGDMHGFSVNHSDENGSNSYSFYSTDMNLVEKMAQLFR